jgi:ribose transport system substrate-binding protein
VVLAILGSALTLAACGGGGSTSTGTTSEGSNPTSESSTAEGGKFAAAVAKFEQPVTTFPGPKTPVDPPSGKKVVVVTCSSQGTGCVRAAEGATEAGQKLGWKVQTIDGQGTPDGWNSAILSAISSKADGIILDAVPPPLVGDALEKAKAAGIPLVSVFNPKPAEAGDVFAYVTPDHKEQGVAMADWVADDSGEEAKIVLVEDKEFPELQERVAGFEEEISKCSGCEILTHVNSQIGTMAQQLPRAIVSALQSNPQADYVVSPYDSNAMFASQGVQQAGKAEEVKVTGYEGDPQAIAAIREGEIQAATAADPAEWMGWQGIDELARAFTGAKPEDTPTAWRLIDAGNVPETEGYLGDLDYKSEFEKLWGLSK